MYTKQVGNVRYNTLGGPKENLTNFSPSSTRAKKKVHMRRVPTNSQVVEINPNQTKEIANN
jgi:hypothetical protein